MKQLRYILLLFGLLVLSYETKAQDWTKFAPQDPAKRIEICYFQEMIKKNVHGLSFIVRTVYNSNLTEMTPYIIIGDEHTNMNELDIEHLLSYSQAVEVQDYLKTLLESSSSHPEGITRVYYGPDGLVIKASDWGDSYHIDFICSSRYKANIFQKKELQDWIDCFDACFHYISTVKKSS